MPVNRSFDGSFSRCTPFESAPRAMVPPVTPGALPASTCTRRGGNARTRRTRPWRSGISFQPSSTSRPTSRSTWNHNDSALNPWASASYALVRMRGPSSLHATLCSSACCRCSLPSSVRRSPTATRKSMISASGRSNAGPGSLRGHTSSSRSSSGVAKSLYSVKCSGVGSDTRPRTTCGTDMRIVVEAHSMTPLT